MSHFRLLSYLSEKDMSRAGLVVNDLVYDLEQALVEVGHDHAQQGSTVLCALKAWKDVRPQVDRFVSSFEGGRGGVILSEGKTLESVQILAPVLYPGVLYCAGANYRDHVFEMTGKDPPENNREPFFFLKTTAGSIIGPGQKIRLPRISSKVDWEAEIAMVIGITAKNVPVEKAMDHVAGLTIMNDLSARDLTKRDDVPFLFDWVGQKCFDTSAPMGPWITPTDAIADLDKMDIKLWVNDDLKQDSDTGQLIFNFQEQVAYLSRHVTLNPGDVIATGTPAGCGMPKGKFLKPGDRIRIQVSGLGEIRNPVVAG
jgi:2-keto-4-pentenoate hydratase/2-oxohepta-3-ene-1,7-dioic acid hydratase in catechol pathway